MDDALRIIVARCSLQAARTATGYLKELHRYSSPLPAKYGRLIKQALNEVGAAFTTEEREFLVNVLTSLEIEVVRSEVLTIRLTPAEKASVESMASAAGMSTSDYARKKILLVQV